MTWLVVHFVDTDEVEVVPSNWYIQRTKECFWPPYKSSLKLITAIKGRTSSGPGWSVIKARVLGKYDKFDTANKKCMKAKDTDNLSSHPEITEFGKGCRKRAKPQRLLNDNSSSDDEETCDEISMPEVPATLQRTTLRRSRSKLQKSSSPHSTLEHSITGLNAVVNKKRLENSSRPHQSSSRDRSYSKNLKDDFVNLVAASAAMNDDESAHTDGISSLQETHNRKNQKQGTKNTSTDLNTKLESHMQQEKEFRKVILKELYTNSCTLEKLIESIDKSLLRTKSNSTATKHGDSLKNPMPILERCPIKNREDLQAMEDFLRTPANVEALMKDLSRLGGSNLKEVTKRMCFAVVDDKLAITYSWDGAKGKKKFRELRLATAIQKAVLLCEKFTTSTEHDITAIIKSWLVGAIGRMKKQNLNNVENNKNNTTNLENETEASSANISCEDSHTDDEPGAGDDELNKELEEGQEESDRGDVSLDGH